MFYEAESFFREVPFCFRDIAHTANSQYGFIEWTIVWMNKQMDQWESLCEWIKLLPEAIGY